MPKDRLGPSAPAGPPQRAPRARPALSARAQSLLLECLAAVIGAAGAALYFFVPPAPEPGDGAVVLATAPIAVPGDVAQPGTQAARAEEAQRLANAAAPDALQPASATTLDDLIASLEQKDQLAATTARVSPFAAD